MSEGKHRFAKPFHLWALGVGAVISGDFFGWQAALAAGFDGLLIVLAVTTVLYILLAFSIAELSAMLPTGGGPYVFSLHGIGSSAAFFAGIAESLKVIATVVVVVVGIGSYLNQLIDLSDEWSPLWWVIFYVVFIGLNTIGVELSFRVQLVATVLSILLLLVFYVAAATQISYDEWVAKQDWKFPDGFTGVIKGFSFSLWFYLGIEELPLAVEETIDPVKNMPRGLITSIATLVVVAFCTVIFNSMISPGASVLVNSGSPLLDGYNSVFGDNSTTAGFTWLLVVGLVCSFHSFMFCMGRLLYAIAKDGYFPAFLTKVTPKRDTPWVAFVVGSSIGLFIALILHFSIGDTRLGSVLVNLALIGALVSYVLQLSSFIALRIKEPERARPYRSPFGVTGAVICIVLCAWSFFTIIYSGASDSDFLASIIAAALFFVAGAVYFFTHLRHRLPHTTIGQERLLSSGYSSSKV